MASTSPGIIGLNNIEFVIQDETYQKQLQTPYNPRFSTGDASLGDLSFFQYVAMEDFSGGTGQDTFTVNNKFFDCEGIDVTKQGELKLAPKVEFVRTINGPKEEHLNRPVEEEDAWPQIIEWLGKAVIYNDKTEHDAGGLEFLEVFETNILQDKVINRDTTATVGVITNDTRAQITKISKVQGLPGDTFLVSVKFKKPRVAASVLNNTFGIPKSTDDLTISFRLDFGGDAEEQSKSFSIIKRKFRNILFTRSTITVGSLPVSFLYYMTLTEDVNIDFTIRVPNKKPGIYKLWTSCRIKGTPLPNPDSISAIDIINDVCADSAANANVLFLIQSVDTVLVERKNLYAPQLKAATTVGSQLVGGRTIGSVGFVEVYELQNGAVDRTLQLSLSTAGITPSNPTYMQMIGSNDVVIAAFDNRIYKIDVQSDGLTAAQRFTFIGEVPGDYVSGLALWNQRVYIGSFSKSQFVSVISWTDGTEIQGSYTIDGKFWITDMANFQGALFYSGGTQDKKGQVRAYPAEIIIETEHPAYDARVRSLNAGRKLYFGISHGVGVGAITEDGASPWSKIDLLEDATNVVWDIEEVGDSVFFLADAGIFKTVNGRYIANGFLETSELGGNTPLIDKIWSTVTIETEPLEGGHLIRVLAKSAVDENDQWNFLGEMTSTDGTKKNFSVPGEFTSQWIKIRLELSTMDENTTPIVKKLLVKYVPATLQKLQWTFAIRATDGLLLLDKQKEGRTGEQIIEDIWELTQAGVIPFRDKDENEYDVIITDVKETAPIINKDQPESIIAIELLEV